MEITTYGKCIEFHIMCSHIISIRINNKLENKLVKKSIVACSDGSSDRSIMDSKKKKYTNTKQTEKDFKAFFNI